MLETFGGSFSSTKGLRALRFARNSYLEFFLARRLADHLPGRPGDGSGHASLDDGGGWLCRQVGAGGRAAVLPAAGGPGGPVLAGRRPASGGRSRGNGGRGRQRRPAPVRVAALGPDRRKLAAWAGGLAGFNVDLGGENLTGVSLVEADLTGGNLAAGRLEQADLRRASPDAGESEWRRVYNRADLTRVDATQADLSLVDAGAAACETACSVTRGSVSRLVGLRLDRADWGNADITLAMANSPTNPFDTAPWRALPPQVSIGLSSGHRGSVYSVSWSPNGGRLASGGEAGTVRIWDGTDGRVARDAEGDEQGAQECVLSVSWSPDGERLASGGEDGTVRIWDARTGESLATLEGTTGRVCKRKLVTGRGTLGERRCGRDGAGVGRVDRQVLAALEGHP